MSARSEQRQFYRGDGRETLLHEARAVEVISFFAQTGECQRSEAR